MKYELIKLRNRYKIASEKHCIALLAAAVDAHNNMPAMFDDGRNKVPDMAHRVEADMLQWCEAHTVGFINQNKIRMVLDDNYYAAYFFSNVDFKPFCSIAKCNKQ